MTSSSPPSEAALGIAPGLEVVPLADGRLRLRNGRRTTVVGGVAEADLRRLLDLVDGRRSMGDLQRELAAEFEAEGVRAVVGTLLRCGALLAEAGGGTEEGGGREAPTVSNEPPAVRRAEAATPTAAPSKASGHRPGRPPSVGIVGGGTAGYLAALALRSHRPDVPVTLIESSAVPLIGVGEATTPLLPQFLHADLGLDVHDLFREVRPTFKLGIRFDWGPGPDDRFAYPFGPLRLLEPAVYDGNLEASSLRALLMAAGRVPLFQGEGQSLLEAGFGTAAAYHLDNAPFVAWLQRQAAALGVEPVDARIAAVRLAGGDEGGAGEGRGSRESREGRDGAGWRADAGGGRRVEELVAEDGRRFRFDLYLDCSGFRSLLLGEALGSPWEPFDGHLLNDRALLFRGPLPAGGPPPHTGAAAWDAGWCWSVPQREETHHGYVYGSAFLSDEEAAAEVARRRPDLARDPSWQPGRVVRFRSGRHRHFVLGNVAALGNAYGFVEPLESTALHLVVRQIGILLRLLPWRAEEGEGRLALANRRVAGWWDYLRDFLALHFRFNRRMDTAYWRACRSGAAPLGSPMAELVESFRRRGPLTADPSLGALLGSGAGLPLSLLPDPLWGPEGIDLLLLGQGMACPLPSPVTTEAEHRAAVVAARRRVERGLPHGEALALLDRRPELREAWLEPFREAGRAFR